MREESVARAARRLLLREAAAVVATAAAAAQEGTDLARRLAASECEAKASEESVHALSRTLAGVLPSSGPVCDDSVSKLVRNLSHQSLREEKPHVR